MTRVVTGTDLLMGQLRTFTQEKISRTPWVRDALACSVLMSNDLPLRKRLRPRGRDNRVVKSRRVQDVDDIARDDNEKLIKKTRRQNCSKKDKSIPSRIRLRLPIDDLAHALAKSARIKDHSAEYKKETKEYSDKCVYGDVARAFSATLIFAQAEGGSAVMVSGCGDIITAAHCLGDVPKIGLQRCLLFSDGTICVARSTAVNVNLDIALMKCLLIYDPTNTQAKAQKMTKSKGRRFPWRQASKPFAFVDIMCERDPDSAILATAEANPPKRKSKRLRQAKLHVPLMCIGQSILARHRNICFSSGQYLGVYKGHDAQMGKLMHSAWTYYGTSGGPLFFRGKLVGVHTSWDSSTCTRHGAHWRDIKKFLEKNKKWTQIKSMSVSEKGQRAGARHTKRKRSKQR